MKICGGNIKMQNYVSGINNYIHHYCNKCGSEINEYMKFCFNCGTKFYWCDYYNALNAEMNKRLNK